MDKEFQVLPSNGLCWGNSLHCDRAVGKILFKSMMCLNKCEEMCYLCNDQYSRARDGTGRDTRSMQELYAQTHPELRNPFKEETEIQCAPLLCCMLKWKLQRCYTFRSP